MVKKYYAIKRGKETGIFEGKWKEIEQKYIKGFSKPQFKGFNSKEAAENYINEPNKKRTENKTQKKIWHGNSKQIKFDSNREDHVEMRTVLIVISGHQNCFSINKTGYYRYILIDEKTNKYVSVNPSPSKQNLTPNRAIIEGIIDAISRLKQPCHIKLYAKTAFGFVNMIKGGKGPNADMLKLLRTELLNKNHVVEELISPSLIVEEYFDNYV
ncbi:hypothetical protein PAECIP111891_03173 [Paenibacillus allorhizoplanae]|uniref:Ribonuclease H1 N-terminal domain-containing protein n=1 Tax=Paenibacillus allorhizoplanae TaxID=2905648 RepID=A0ABN8GJ06_9BACL|nr:RNase H1/viroplasmin domain-containing protein [Paenibacillus allorhizoplanae]CAH1208191.1 hypothetical protein PAECIP111891_03173 [Paenibacillus allorhizoplanae]